MGSNLFKLDQTCLNWNTLVQIGLNLFKMDQTCPNWIKLVQIGSNLSKLVQTCTICIKMSKFSQIWNNCFYVKLDIYYIFKIRSKRIVTSCAPIRTERLFSLLHPHFVWWKTRPNGLSCFSGSWQFHIFKYIFWL